ncbi:MAG: zinc-ribbon domain-containing protein [Candidatus Bathyarchaeota archaeon]|nr:MAG: zinc-ribbon domain-containing protein [Candidatus Bathyarchaeota archaeon]
MPYCQECGKEVGEDAVYCPHCGAQILETGAPYRRPTDLGWTIGRLVVVFIGGILIIASLGLIAGGGAIIWVEGSFSDDEGFLVSRVMRLNSDSYAVVFREFDVHIDMDIPSTVWTRPRPQDIVTVKLVAESNVPGKQVFVGIARAPDAAHYLEEVGYDIVSNYKWSYDPFSGERPRITYYPDPGGAPSAPPTAQGFWEASATGSGTQILEWEPQTGSYWVVAMNADGSSEVDIGIQLGVRITILHTISYVLVGAGIVLLLVGFAIARVGVLRGF